MEYRLSLDENRVVITPNTRREGEFLHGLFAELNSAYGMQHYALVHSTSVDDMPRQGETRNPRSKEVTLSVITRESLTPKSQKRQRR